MPWNNSGLGIVIRNCPDEDVWILDLTQKCVFFSPWIFQPAMFVLHRKEPLKLPGSEKSEAPPETTMGVIQRDTNGFWYLGFLLPVRQNLQVAWWAWFQGHAMLKESIGGILLAVDSVKASYISLWYLVSPNKFQTIEQHFVPVGDYPP